MNEIKRKDNLLKEGKAIYDQTMQDIEKGGDHKILIITDQAKDRCDRKYNIQDAQWCRLGVTERMESDLQAEWKKKHGK